MRQKRRGLLRRITKRDSKGRPIAEEPFDLPGETDRLEAALIKMANKFPKALADRDAA